jgi:hypothetical protein
MRTSSKGSSAWGRPRKICPAEPGAVPEPLDRELRLTLLAEMVSRAERLTGTEAAAAVPLALRRGLDQLGPAAESGGPAGQPADQPVALLPPERETERSAAEFVRLAVQFDLLRIRALRLQARLAPAETRLYELVDQSQALQDRAWELRAAVERLKQVLDRPVRPTPRPEPPLAIGLGGSARLHPPVADFLLRDQRLVAFPLVLSTESAARYETLGAAATVPADWGDLAWEHLLARGLARLELDAGGVEQPAAPRRVDPHHLATLQRQVLEWEQNLKVLELRTRALEVDNQGLGRLVERLGNEARGLDAELAARGPSLGRPKRRGWSRLWPFGRHER